MLGFSPLGDLPLAGLPGGDGSIFGVLYVDLDTFGAATIGRGAVNISGVLYANPDTFGGNTVSASYAITGTHYSDADTFGAATVTVGPVTITGALYADADTFGTHVIGRGAVNINAKWHLDIDSFGVSTVFTPFVEHIKPGQERCMRCGFVKRHSEMRREWTGLLVCSDTCWDPRHPQMSLKGVPDRQNVPWARPEPEPVFIASTDIQPGDL